MFKCLLLAAVVSFSVPSAAREDSLLVMFWNLENFFDWRDDSLNINSSEEEFSSRGKKHWTKRRFYRKCQAVAKTILWVADSRGRLPDAIGFAEVENRGVLEKLLKETVLRRYDYEIVHYDSPDPRGIDVALLYRKTSLNLLYSKTLTVSGRDGLTLSTRDILLTCFEKTSGDSIAFLVNHHPSKYGANSSWRREEALKRLEEATDSLISTGINSIVATGDFNDIPESTKDYSQKMVNLALPLSRKGEGTIKYDGKWELIDMFFISPWLTARNPEARMWIEKPPFLMTRDNTHSGERPIRTYTGPRYTAGVSDHCPITLIIK